MKKKILSFLLTVVMLVGMLPMAALATGTEDEPINNVYFTMGGMPLPDCAVDDYGTYYYYYGDDYYYFKDPYAYNVLQSEDRYDVDLAWYADDGESAISELIKTPYTKSTFDAGDYVMAVTIEPKLGYSAEQLTADDLAFVSPVDLTTDATAPTFEKIGDVFCARISLDYKVINNVYFTMNGMPLADCAVDDYGTYYYYYNDYNYFKDPYAYNVLQSKDRYDVDLAWYKDDSESAISELIKTPYTKSTFDAGDYVMAVTIEPKLGYSAEELTANDLAFVSPSDLTKDDTAPTFEKIDGVFYARIRVRSYEEFQNIAKEKAGEMPLAAAQKLIAGVEDYIVPDSVKYKAMSEHQLAVFDAEDFANDKTAAYLGISSGIILSTGDASAAIKEGAYDDGIGSTQAGSFYNQGYWYGTSYGGSQTNGDIDLFEEFNDYPLFDTATLEFTVKAPEVNYPMSMTFNYVYATREMTQGPQYNDVFALFVSEGYNDLDSPSTNFTNYATMKVDTAGNTGKVTVSNMKEAIAAADAANDNDKVFYVSENSGIKFVDGAKDNDYGDLKDYGLPYNGLTDVYSVNVPDIEPGNYYTIKIAIADASDASFDGAVFLQANSLYFGIKAPKVSGGTKDTDIKLGVKDYGTVYIVPAGQAYTTEDALKEAAVKVWSNDRKNGVSITSGEKDADGYAWSEDVSIESIRPGNYAAYLVAQPEGPDEKVVSLQSETFYTKGYEWRIETKSTESQTKYLMGRQYKIGNETVGRTIIGLTDAQLNSLGSDDKLVIVGSDDKGNSVNVETDCAYSYFLNDGSKIMAEQMNVAAFVIFENDGNGGNISGYGYYRVYKNSADSEENFMFDTLYLPNN